MGHGKLWNPQTVAACTTHGQKGKGCLSVDKAYFVRLYQNKEVIDHEPSINKLLSETRYNPDSVGP